MADGRRTQTTDPRHVRTIGLTLQGTLPVVVLPAQRPVRILGVLAGFWVATLCASGVMAQSVPRVVPGFGVDTTSAAWSDLSWHSAVPEIYRAWSEYLLNQPGSLSPNPRWSAQEQRRWPGYDLTSGIAYNGASATVVDIRPVEEDVLDEFVVKTLFSRVLGENEVKPVALTRVYAFQENGEWGLRQCPDTTNERLGARPSWADRVRR